MMMSFHCILQIKIKKIKNFINILIYIVLPEIGNDFKIDLHDDIKL